MDSYFAKSHYMERENRRRVEDFRDYVKKNELSTTNMENLMEWVEHQSVVWMQIYRDHILLYDSQFPYMKANPEFHVTGQFYEWETYQMVDFKDGPAQVFITGVYTYQFFNYAMIAEFLFSFLLFTGIIMAGIRSPMKYIHTLSAETGILESGNLDYRITIMGNDEMTVLAKGLDNMRKSIREQMAQEARLINLNKSMITSLSHDLRTPLTALLIYTEILKNEIEADREHRQKWICKIDEKAHQIKDMADCILEYSLQKKVEPLPPEKTSFRAAFYDVLSEACLCMEQTGFHVQTDLSWQDRELSIDPKYITRILDNISSNIIKYASRNTPVQITVFYEEDRCGLLIENGRGNASQDVESNGIGVKNICTMMEEMGGRCEVTETEKHYAVRLRFPCSIPQETG